MKKFKINLTIILLYEFIIITLLHMPDYCVNLFNSNFCAIGLYKYFLFCIMIPVSFGLIIWWCPEIANVFRCKKCKCEISDNKTITKKDIEHFALAAVVLLANRFLNKHPKIKDIFDDIIQEK